MELGKRVEKKKKCEENICLRLLANASERYIIRIGDKLFYDKEMKLWLIHQQYMQG